MALDLIALFQNPVFLILLGAALLALFYAAASYLKPLLTALFFDYAIDAGLSFADNFIGAGLAGFDVGDLVAAGILFVTYRKKVGNRWAILFALEATNFGLSFIPGIGEGIELFFGALPLVTIVIFYKHYQANQIYGSVKEYADYLKQEKPEIHDQFHGDIKKLEEEFHACNYQQILDEKEGIGKGIKEGLHQAVEQSIMKKINTAMETLLQMKTEQTIKEEDLQIIQNSIQRTIAEIETDWQQADADANQILRSVSSLSASSKG